MRKGCLFLVLALMALLCAPSGALADDAIYAMIYHPQGEPVTLYAEPGGEGEIVGVYHCGAECHIMDFSGIWAQIVVGRSSNPPTGWVEAAKLSYGEQMTAVQFVPSVPVMRLTRATRLAGQDETYLPGTLVEIVGTLANGWVHVVIANVEGFLPSDVLEETDLTSTLWHNAEGGIPTQGYALFDIKEGEDLPICAAPNPDAALVMGVGASTPVEVLAAQEGWLQVRWYTGVFEGFIPDDGARVYWLDDLHVSGDARGAGTYTAGDALPVGLYGFSLPEGARGMLRAVAADGNVLHEWDAQGESLYALYLPQGATVTLEGDGTLAPLTQERMISEANGWQTAGSGRYLHGWQMDGEQTQTLALTLMDGASSGYYILSTIDTDAGFGPAPRTVEVLPGETHTLHPVINGQMLEFHNLNISAVIGNG